MELNRKEKDLVYLKEEFELFFKRKYSYLYFFALRYTHDEEIAKDLVFECFHFLWEHIDTFRPETALTYTLTHLQRLCIDWLRKKNLQETNMPSYLAKIKEWNEEQWNESEQRIQIIMDIISKMPPMTCDIMKECYLNKLKYKEVADKYSISEHSVKKHIMKGLDIIRTFFSVKYRKGQ